jgi:chromosome segregation protein
VEFSKLRLAGFKSFVEPVELWIETGVTGVVGPNGCGKSNIVEALKWVMGETSAKQMRGGGMEDVIFGGTATRPPRNVAEVSIHLDNTERNAPAQFNDSEKLEITRRIERGEGSNYRINGNEVRARDVQLLFADLATGAHSTAMVNQGRVGALIGAKPTERRMLLEEAAGITGLHSRRHEAELRLRAADTNLERLEDVIQALEGQFQGLKRQARQAARYRRLGGHIRRQEAMLLHLRWLEAAAALVAAQDGLETLETQVAKRTAVAGKAATAQADAAAALPGLRQNEAEAAAELQRVLVARREIEAEKERIAQSLEEVGRRLEQIATDLKRERALGEDAAAALERLEAEAVEIGAAGDDDEARAAARETLDQATADLTAREDELAGLTERLATAEARREALERQATELAEHGSTLAARIEAIEAERMELTADLEADVGLKEAEQAISFAGAAVEAAQGELESAEAAATDAEEKAVTTRTADRDADAAHGRMRAEVEALAELLQEEDGDLFPPLVDAVVVTPGYETALGAALDDDLSAPADTAAPVHWSVLPPLASPPELPEGAAPLSLFVEAPGELSRRLALVGVIEDEARGREIQAKLQAGQRLVSRDGALWRWDGYTVSAGASTTAATRLAQRNRLKQLRGELAGSEKARKTAHAALGDMEKTASQAGERAQAARGALKTAFDELGGARDRHTSLAGATADARSRLGALAEAMTRLDEDKATTEARHKAAEEALAGLEDPAEARHAIEALRTTIAELREVEGERRSAHDRLEREAEHRAGRLRAIAEDTASWQVRAEGVEGRVGELEARRGEVTAEQARLAARPDEIENQLKNLLDVVDKAEAARGAAADRLAEGETRQAEADTALREAEGELATAREDRVRREAEVAQAESDSHVVAERIAERLSSTPETVLADAEIKENTEFPEIEVVEAKLERLERERDNMGPVNLRAEQELEELEEQITTLQTEREDLLAAIARLRQGISSLNREGRERLLAAFADVNTHFEELFTRLFGGGRAHLALTEADDPLEAGLEIMASPPGKKLQVMSLLSGGEQALTALALLFAVFLTNPAPICVLDEVDAPLDDANVERFCDLLNEIAHSGQTRFLIVTHHRITMARVDRLFGVTMGERGVSQLVSVDLGTAEALRETA